MAMTLARGLQARGHDVLVLSRPGSPFDQAARAEFTVAPVLRGADFPVVPVYRVMRALRRHRTDVVLSPLPKDLQMTGLAARMLGIPVVARRVDFFPFGRLPHQKFLDRIPEVYIANSETTRRHMLRDAPWLAPDRIAVIFNGVDVSRFADATPAELNVPRDALVVGFIGRLIERKGLPEIAAAWPRVAEAVPNAHLVIAGSGGWEGEFRKRIAGAPRVHWLGFRSDAPALMQRFDIAIAPSWEEPFGIVAVEAMAAGTPVVAAAGGGFAEVIHDGIDGWLIPVRDADALARAVIALACDADLRQRMGAAAAQRARREFDIGRVVDAYEAVLRRVAAGRSSA
jgi:glycosyltransferase involved in cell wall biosynthesis